RAETLGDLAGDLVLHRGRFGERSDPAIAPELRPLLHVDEVRLHDEAATLPRDAPRHDRLHAEGAPRAPRVGLGPERERARARGDADVGEPREPVDQVLREAVAEI